MAFDIQKSEYQGVPVLRLVDTLMDSDVYWFSRELKALAKSGCPRVIIDVTETSFIDSHGLGVLVYQANNFKKENRGMYILNENQDPEGYVSGLFVTTGLNEVLTIVHSKDALPQF